MVMQALELRAAEFGTARGVCIGEKGRRQGSCTGGGREIGQCVAREESDEARPDLIARGWALTDRCQPGVGGALVQGGRDSDLLFPDSLEVGEELPAITPGQAAKPNESGDPME